jgi:glycine/D-amino acid oxidase-like deaminating enzyme
LVERERTRCAIDETNPSRHPIITDQHVRFDNVVVAAGLGGHAEVE